MIVLVTGATGFLGSHLVRALLQAGHRPRALVRKGSPRAHVQIEGVELVEGELADERSLTAACRGAAGLIHCAARTGFWSRWNEQQRKVNVEGSAALYRSAHKTRVERIVHVSSVAAVGATRDGTILDESATWNLRALGVNYATTKRAGEERALAAAWGGMPLVVVNPAYILGPRLDGKRSSSLMDRIAAGEMRWTPQGGTSVTDVEDVSAGILGALERGREGERYILAGHNLTWEELHRRMARTTGGRAPTRRLPHAAGRALALGCGWLDSVGLARPPWTPEIWRTVGWYSWYDSGKARRELGYQVRELDEILARTSGGPLCSEELVP